MITLTKNEINRQQGDNTYTTLELRGLSTDEKPTQFSVFKVDNGSVFIEIDTGKVFMYDLDNQEWKEI